MHLRYKTIIQTTCLLAILLLFPKTIYGQGGTIEPLAQKEAATEEEEKEIPVIYTPEGIQNFHSYIKIDPSGRIVIVENISVHSVGYQIKRGIVRTIPTYRYDKYGKRQETDIKLLSVMRDSLPESYDHRITNGDYSIYIGNKNQILPPGDYKYTIAYETYGQIGFFDDFDELYWNVTGNNWNFNIKEASATIYLPEGAKIKNTACYTGIKGSTDQDCLYYKDSTSVTFICNKELYMGEGFTVAAAFTRDIIKRPPPPTKKELFFMQYGLYVYILIAFIIIMSYFYFTWRRVGRDPRKPVVIPTFRPPNNLSPAAIRYLYKKKYDDKIFTVTILNLAVKGYLFINKVSSKYILEQKVGTKPLSSDEAIVLEKLFDKKTKVLPVTNKHHNKFSNAIYYLQRCLQQEWVLKEYFRKNSGYAVVGFLLIFLILSVLAKLPFNPQPTISPILISLAFIIVILVAYGFYIYLIKAPTEMGIKLSAEIEGFIMYLKTAEEDRLNMLTPPEHTPELFEELLPYAIALDVENEWGKKFDSLLKEVNYSPDWYTKDTSYRFNTFSRSLSNSFTNSVRHARVDPAAASSSGSSGSSSWSSGSSGGGSSGGGGGGGGGGGW